MPEAGTEKVDELDVMSSCFRLIDQLPEPEKKRVILWLSEKFSVDLRGARQVKDGREVAISSRSSTPMPSGTSPKAFLALKKPDSNPERIACLAFYLTYYRETPHFKTPDITKLNVEAAQPALANAKAAVNDAAKKSHFLAAAGGGKKQITSRGEALVNNLPDREKARIALAELPLKRKGARHGAQSKNSPTS